MKVYSVFTPFLATVLVGCANPPRYNATVYTPIIDSIGVGASIRIPGYGNVPLGGVGIVNTNPRCSVSQRVHTVDGRGSGNYTRICTKAVRHGCTARWTERYDYPIQQSVPGDPRKALDWYQKVGANKLAPAFNNLI
jgi:hypothetical protein